MNPKTKLMIALLAISTFIVIPMVIASPPVHLKERDGWIYVTSQNKYYRTIVPVTPDKGLPYKGHNGGSFQELYNGMTDYGPGDPGYRGGRWWIDTNGNQMMDMDDTYFLCPLLGPGYDEIPQ